MNADFAVERLTDQPRIVGEPIIEIANVHKNYGSFAVLADVSLTVGRSERIVICGPSGSGKSTLLRWAAFAGSSATRVVGSWSTASTLE